MTSEAPTTELQKATLTVLTTKMSELGLSVRPLPHVSEGPVVTVYRFLPYGSTKVAQLEALSQDFAVVLGAEDIVVKRVPGEVAVSIFVPNKARKDVYWRDICGIPPNGHRPSIPLLMGIDNLGKRVVEDLTYFPHLLVAGSTGSGKSTWMNSEIATILLNYSPDEVKLVLSDTKGVEFNHFRGSPHLLYETARTTRRTVEYFDKLIEMMEKRLESFGSRGLRNITEHNNVYTTNRLPYVCILIDEVADILTDESPYDQNEDASSRKSLGKVAERKLCRLAAKARASGIHVIAATQRPSVKIVQGDIKANFLGRLSFRLPSEADSRTVLSQGGAEHLLSRGDMLFVNPNRAGIQRIHAPIASIEDIQAAISFASRR